MRKVAIIGIGQTPVAEHWTKSLKELAGEAIFAALEDADMPSVEALYVGNMLSGLLELTKPSWPHSASRQTVIPRFPSF